MHDVSYLRDVLILLLASVFIVIVFKQFKLSPALGYLVAGAAIGPFGFGIVSTTETTRSFAELGVVFLLFAIGLDLTLERLMSMRRYVLGFGGLQILLSSIAISLICYFAAHLSLETSVIVGCALSMSSTAIVMQVLSEKGENSTRVGRLSFSILLMQDLAVIPILVLLPILSKTELHILPALGGAIIDAAIALTIIIATGRFLLRPIYRLIVESKSDVLFLSLTLIVILGSAFITNKMGMSFALGAFIAGLMVAETEYKYRVEDEILSLKSLLLGLFFMTIGMSFDFDMMIASFPYIILAAATLILVKTLVIVLLCKIFKFPTPPAIHTGLLLSQGGEFAFVVFLMSVQKKLIDQDLSQFLMTVTTLTMALTPLLATVGRKIKTRLYVEETLRENKIKREIGDLRKHILIIGFSTVGRIIAYNLNKKEINHIILDSNHRLVRIEKNNGHNIYYGDPTNLDILKYVGIEHCDSVIVALEDEVACTKIVEFIHKNFGQISIISSAEKISDISKLQEAGSNQIFTKEIEVSLQISKILMTHSSITESEALKAIDSFRRLDKNIVNEICNF